MDVDCGVAYDSDLAQVRDVVLAAMADFPELLTEQPPQVMFTSFADSAINFSLRFWIPYRWQVDYVGAKSEAIMRIKKAFDAAGIVIPFPLRTLELPPELLAYLAAGSRQPTPLPVPGHNPNRRSRGVRQQLAPPAVARAPQPARGLELIVQPFPWRICGMHFSTRAAWVLACLGAEK